MEKRQRQIHHQRSEAAKRRKAGDPQAADHIELQGGLNEGEATIGNNGEEVPPAARRRGHSRPYTTYYEGNDKGSSDDNSAVSSDGEGDKVDLKKVQWTEGEGEGEVRVLDAARCSSKIPGDVAQAKAANKSTLHIGGGIASDESMLHPRDDATNEDSFKVGGSHVLPSTTTTSEGSGTSAASPGARGEVLSSTARQRKGLLKKRKIIVHAANMIGCDDDSHPP